MKVWLKCALVLLCIWVLGCCAGCRRRPTPAGPSPSTSAASAPVVPSASAAAPDPCPRLGEEGTPWSHGGLVRSLTPEAVLEPAELAARAEGFESGWELTDPLKEGQSDGVSFGIAALHATGTGAAIVTLRQVDVGYCVTGVWFYAFGGAGVSVTNVAAAEARSGEAALMTYAVTEGWNGGGPVAWQCKLVTVRVGLRGLLKIHETPGVDCPAKAPAVRIERKQDKTWLREGSKVWPIDD